MNIRAKLSSKKSAHLSPKVSRFLTPPKQKQPQKNWAARSGLLNLKSMRVDAVKVNLSALLRMPKAAYASRGLLMKLSKMLKLCSANIWSQSKLLMKVSKLTVSILSMDLILTVSFISQLLSTAKHRASLSSSRLRAEWILRLWPMTRLKKSSILTLIRLRVSCRIMAVSSPSALSSS